MPEVQQKSRTALRVSQRLVNTALAIFAALLALGVAIVALRLWRADVHVPLNYTTDALLHLR